MGGGRVSEDVVRRLLTDEVLKVSIDTCYVIPTPALTVQRVIDLLDERGWLAKVVDHRVVMPSDRTLRGGGIVAVTKSDPQAGQLAAFIPGDVVPFSDLKGLKRVLVQRYGHRTVERYRSNPREIPLSTSGLVHEVIGDPELTSAINEAFLTIPGTVIAPL